MGDKAQPEGGRGEGTRLGTIAHKQKVGEEGNILGYKTAHAEGDCYIERSNTERVHAAC